MTDNKIDFMSISYYLKNKYFTFMHVKKYKWFK